MIVAIASIAGKLLLFWIGMSAGGILAYFVTERWKNGERLAREYKNVVSFRAFSNTYFGLTGWLWPVLIPGLIFLWFMMRKRILVANITAKLEGQ